jgi:hypothetical protein
MGWLKRVLGTPAEGSKRAVAVPPGEVAEVEPALKDDSAIGVASEVATVIARWDRRIAKIQTSFDAVLAEAEAASEPVIAAIRSDLGDLSRLWSVVEHKKHQHCSKIANRWDKISDELSELDGLTPGTMDQQGVKRDLGQCEIEVRYHRVYRDVFARAAETLRQRAESSGDSEARALFVGSGALCLAQKAAFDAWEIMTRTEVAMNQYHDDRDVPLELLERYQAAATEYWTTLLNVEADHVPEIRQHVPTKLQRYTKDISKTLRRYWQWREREKQATV